MNKSQTMYKNLSRYYKSYRSGKCTHYLSEIDKIIISASNNVNCYLDVGTGDGARGLNIAKNINAKKIVLLDESGEMLSYVPKTKGVEIVNSSIQNYNKTNNKFDLITCLWNVFGHVDAEDHEKALMVIKKLLKNNGRIFIDVHNRYNIRSYGFPTVLKNILKDVFLPGKKNGDVNFKIKIDGVEIPSFVHFFSPKEIESLFKKQKLKIVRRYVLDYDNGRIYNSIFNGQLLYELEK